MIIIHDSSVSLDNSMPLYVKSGGVKLWCKMIKIICAKVYTVIGKDILKRKWTNLNFSMDVFSFEKSCSGELRTLRYHDFILQKVVNT